MCCDACIVMMWNCEERTTPVLVCSHEAGLHVFCAFVSFVNLLLHVQERRTSRIVFYGSVVDGDCNSCLLY